MRKKTILIDVSPAMPGNAKERMGNYVSGIGQAAIGLVNALNNLTDIPYNIELYALGTGAKYIDYSCWNFKGYKLPFPPKIINPLHLQPFLRSCLTNYDLYHVLTNIAIVSRKEPFIVTIHDCTDMDEKSSLDLSSKERILKKQRYQLGADASKAIVTVSNFSKSEIVKYFNVNPDKIFVNHLGIDRGKFKTINQEMINKVLSIYNVNQPYFFACSCTRKRKNIITALRAFKKFLTYHPEHIFIVAWSNPFPEIMEEFASEINNRKIRFLPFLTDEEIVAFYNGASMSVYVSRKEGFGLPILESFACGTPVMTCCNSSLPEVGQDAAIYVGEDNIDEMVDVMKMFEDSMYDISEFKIKSEKVLSQFTWENTARRCLSIYDKCINV